MPFKTFCNCFLEPPNQGSVGRNPESYLSELGSDHVKLIQIKIGKLRKLTRFEVRDICRDHSIDVLTAYAVAMAWGGQDMGNFRKSISDNTKQNLYLMLEQLRKSSKGRKFDFEFTKESTETIKGLGISFYTKLLFFFRNTSDAYILDQWTAKSATLLFKPSPVLLTPYGLPSPNTTPADYDLFCKELENLGTRLNWSGEEVERAIFDKPNGKWRQFVVSQFPAKNNADKKKSKKWNGILSYEEIFGESDE